MRSVAEAEKYFKDLGKVLTNQPDRNQRAKFMQTMRRTDPDYQEAVGALRLRTRLKRAGVDTEKFQIQPIGELAIQLANAPVKTRFIGMTPYGAPITEFDTKGLTHRIIPIRIEVKRIKLIIPAASTGHVYGILQEYKESEEWLSNGNLQAILNIPAGLLMDFYERINHLTHGSVQSEELDKEE